MIIGEADQIRRSSTAEAAHQLQAGAATAIRAVDRAVAEVHPDPIGEDRDGRKRQLLNLEKNEKENIYNGCMCHYWHIGNGPVCI